MRLKCDYLVIGSGVAGLTFALEAAKTGEVLVLAKRSIQDSSTARAQGGIAAVLDSADSIEAHMRDTLEAGRGISHPDVVEMVVRDAPERIRELIRIGAAFDKAETCSNCDADLDLTQEGGHSARRIVHAADLTGAEVQRALFEAVSQNKNIRVLENHMAIDLIDMSKHGSDHLIVGAYVLDENANRVRTVMAKATILASGGAGKVYLYTSNPDVASGDGIAMAYRVGADIANMEFFQFHPTCLFHPLAKNFLISESLRGEGGILRLRDGTAFMEKHSSQNNLAPRDVVTYAIDYELKRTGDDHVLLDMTSRPAQYLKDRFPNIYRECMKFGIDMAVEPIPVVPAAHYLCGGVRADKNGHSSVRGLWAIGECACTGLHGANRLASNSLLEGLVYGKRAALSIPDNLPAMIAPDPPDWDIGEAVPSDEAVVVSQNWDELRRFMWNYVGIVRSDKRLERARRRIALLDEEIREYYWKHLLTRDFLELRNIADVARLIVSCAAFRKESRGSHINNDHLQADEGYAADTVISKDSAPRLSFKWS
jgi:L-aspartate oxidase